MTPPAGRGAISSPEVRASLVARPLAIGRGRSILVHPRSVILGLGLGVLILVLAVVGAAQGSTPLTLPQIAAALQGVADPSTEAVVWNIRAPRVLAALLIGAALGASGAVFQSTSRNALGSPDIIGFLTGAATGAVAAIVIGHLGPAAVALASFAGGLVTVGIVFALSARGGSLGGERIVLIGIGVGALLGAVNTILLTKTDPDVAIAGRIWLTGSLNARTWESVAIAAVGLGVFWPMLLLLGRRLDALESGDDIATQAGVPVRSTRLLAGIAGTGLAAAATAAAGPISCIALAAPHLARALGRSGSVPVILAALIGAVLLQGADILSQSLPLPVRLPVAVTTGVLGGVYLLTMLRRLR